VIVHLGRHQAMGAGRRVASLRAIFESAGADVAEVPLMAASGPPTPHLARADARLLVAGQLVPERLAWSLRDALETLRRQQPEVLVLETARAFHTAFLGCAPVVVLDLVDALSRSYAQRAHLSANPLRRLALEGLSRSHRRFERGIHRLPCRAVVDGIGDARLLGVEWVPITVDDRAPVDAAMADHDVLFVGTLSYPPNVAALQRLARMWPPLQRRVAGISCLVAGARPGAQVVRMATAHGWDLCADFDDVASIHARGRVAVAPLDHAAGIQIKVLDAAALGVPQVVSPTAVAGLADGLPAEVADGDQQFVNAISRLLADPARRAELAAAARAHVIENYSVDRWSRWADAVMGSLRTTHIASR
jgi:glycosyltransferase involved in cell wall biosynthesis